MNKIVNLFDKLAPKEGFNTSNVKGVNFVRISRSVRIEPYIYNSSVAIIFQGKKIGHFGDKLLNYNANNYLVFSTPMPLECETIATKEEPLLGMTIDIDFNMLNELISMIEKPSDVNLNLNNNHKCVESIPVDDDLLEIIEKLLTVMQNPQDSRVLAPNILREILYNILKDGRSSSLFAITEHGNKFSRIAKVLRNIHSNYSKNISVEEMAKDAQMGVSSFHREFKKVTEESAIQYLKKFRLTKAKNFIIQDGLNANSAAYKVGYESVSQFSREFKRLFGNPPSYYS